MDQAATTPDRHSDGHHAAGEHPSFLAHHFDSPQQQFDAGKLGMWLFLITEILFFSGLFLAYAVFRARHPEVFADAHQFLDKTLGAVNTVVLLFSSLTMAWAVRCVQLNQRRGLVFCLTTTLACASFFLGIKAIEYSHKWDLGLYWAGRYAPHGEHHAEHGLSPLLIALSAPFLLALVVFVGWTVASYLRGQRQTLVVVGGLAITAAAFFVGIAAALVLPALVGGSASGEHSEAEATAPGQSGGDAGHAEDAGHAAASGTDPAAAAEGQTAPKVDYAGIFFSIYYGMTGVHALHILGGMGVIAWLLLRSVRGDFSPQYFGPVDYVGLYWHLVDLVWIYLFPLLYLIH